MRRSTRCSPAMSAARSRASPRCAPRIRRPESPREQPVELKRFYVDKPWQGRGVARQLMDAVETAARARGGAGVLARRVGTQRARAGVLPQMRLPQGGHADFRRRHGSADRPRDAARNCDDACASNTSACGWPTSTRWPRSTRSILTPRSARSTATRARDSNRAFSTFGSGARLEVMTRRGCDASAPRASSWASRTWRSPSATKPRWMRWRCVSGPMESQPDSGPRRTGDGYYECVVRDPEGNRVEIAAG